MENSVWSVLSKLPKPIRDQVARYRNWLNQNFNSILRDLPMETRTKLNKNDFVEFAILKLVYDIPKRGLSIIMESLDLLQLYDIEAISITGVMFHKDSESLIRLSALVEALAGIIKESKLDFIITSRNLIDLAKEMVRKDYE
jgi:hypothetical protein